MIFFNQGKLNFVMPWILAGVCIRKSRLIFGVLQWLVRSAVSRIRSYVYDSRRVRFLPVKVYERYMLKIVCYLCALNKETKAFSRG